MALLKVRGATILLEEPMTCVRVSTQCLTPETTIAKPGTSEKI